MVSEAKMVRVLDKLSTGHSIKSTMKSIGYNPCTFYAWMQTVVEPFEWQHQSDTFSRHVRRARAMSIMSLDSQVRDEAEHGTPMYVGKDPVWQVDNKIASDARILGDVEWFNLYGLRDRSDVYERDEDGALIQARGPLAASLRAVAIKGLMPKQYGDRSTVDITSKHTISGSITVGKPRLDAETAARIAQQKAEAHAHLNDPQRVVRPTAPVQVGRVADEPPPPRPPYARPLQSTDNPRGKFIGDRLDGKPSPGGFKVC